MPDSDPAQPSAPPRRSIYGRAFWLAYLANVSLVTANALTFRFADFVAQVLGGTEAIAGTIISAGIVVALLARFGLGQAIDRYGVRRLWILCSLLFLAGSLIFPLCESVSWPIYLARVAFTVGLAGMFTCSIVHVQNLVPPERRTEIIGNLGSSGFVAMVLGAQLGDAILHATDPGRMRYLILFGGTFLLGLVHLLLVIVLTRRDVHVAPGPMPPAHKLLVRHWPGNVVLVAMMMGVGVAVIMVFLTRYTTHLGMPSAFGTFFAGYAASAFLFRLGAQNWSRTMGRHRMILLGLAGHCVAHAMLPLMREPWHFLAPAVAGGFGHALLFPAVVSLGSGAFPKAYRGTGTALVLGFVDLGTGLFAPLLGGIIDYFDGAGFPQMFLTSSATALAIGVYYGLTTARRPDDEAQTADEPVTIRAVPQEAHVAPVPQYTRSA